MLLLLAVPGHLAFIVAICAAESLGVPSPLFVLLYLLAAVMQVPSQLVTSLSRHSSQWSQVTSPVSDYRSAPSDPVLVMTGRIVAMFRVQHLAGGSC